MSSISKKVGKPTKRESKLHPRDSRSRRHAEWKRNIRNAMRRAKLRRREAGLVTYTEAAVETCLPLYAIKRLIASGELKAVDAGSHRYILRGELDRWKAHAGLNAA
jgi:excisionase family DNA binding protein